ncbi:hypothetical protein [uncultured Mediterranean phage uvMED]|nr:hypothetical protein [uncultured Mediterranean phage uvMED]
MDDRDFKLAVLRLTLENGTGAVYQDRLKAAQENLEWCLAPLDKPRPKAAAPRKTRNPGQAKAPGADSVLFTIE